KALYIQIKIEETTQSDLVNISTIYSNIECILTDVHLFLPELIDLEKDLDIRL
ncbi:unnamed protein product, partial [Rotaria sp. Silwood2]